MTRRSSHVRDARGETLIELLVAMSILGVAVVALVGGIGTSIVVTDAHRKQATAEAVIHTFAESIESSVAAIPTAYASCPSLSTYTTPAGFAVPAGFTAAVTAVTYWNGAPAGSFVTTCSSDVGIQKLTLSVASTDLRATETLNIVIRKPCRAADLACS